MDKLTNDCFDLSVSEEMLNEPQRGSTVRPIPELVEQVQEMLNETPQAVLQ